MTSEGNAGSKNLSGMMVGRYYLDSRIGSGGFGNVYKCLDVLNGEVLAIKLMDNNPKSAELMKHEVAAQEILSKYPDCNKYVLCMYNHGNHLYDGNIKIQLRQIAEAKRLGTTIEAQIEEMESAGSAGRGVMSGVKKAQLSTITQSMTREIMEAQERYPISKDAVQVPENYYYIVTELMDGDLDKIKDLIFQKKVRPDARSIDYIVRSLVYGLEYIHDMGLSHMDVKLPNILWRVNSYNGESVTIEQCLSDHKLAEKHLQVAYGDLGFTCVDEKDVTKLEKDLRPCDTNGATPVSLSPELVREFLGKTTISYVSLKRAQSDDVWALGVMLWELIYGDEPPYLEGVEDKYELIRVLESLVDKPGFITEEINKQKPIPEEIQVLFELMFNPDGSTRANIGELADIVTNYL